MEIYNQQHDQKLALHESNLAWSVRTAGTCWSSPAAFRPYILLADGNPLYFDQAENIEHQSWQTGLGQGIRSVFRGFSCNQQPIAYAFETIIWSEASTGHVYFEWLPVCEEGLEVKAVYWPAPVDFQKARDDHYSLLTYWQGLLLPNTWPHEVKDLAFDGQLCSSAAYMPWFGQVKSGQGYLAICLQPWDAAYQVDHPDGGPGTALSYRWLPSLGSMRYRRCLKYVFADQADYNSLCKIYRRHVRESGLLTTLAEKAARNPLVDKLIGSAIVHKGAKTHIVPESYYYDAEHPERNDRVETFAEREAEIKYFRDCGIEKLYLHLDGWGEPGYDNQHPDYLPACREAGGWAGLKSLSDTMQACGYLLGLHDQYRDYYFDAKTFDREFACHDPEGRIFEHARWAGGRQTYLCATQAPAYVRRNFSAVFRHGIHLEATYLDVFACNEADECSHKWHSMTRKECLEYRLACFAYLTANQILPSSEECCDWAMQQLVFAHYGPHDFMLQKADAPRKGIPVPLFNLVYHDCMVLPWFMDQTDTGEDYMLYALLNGGAAYLDRDHPFPAGDSSAARAAYEDRIASSVERYRIVAALQEKVAKCEMIRHEFMEGKTWLQKTCFSDGTEVEINLQDNTYSIRPAGQVTCMENG